MHKLIQQELLVLTYAKNHTSVKINELNFAE